MTTTKKTQTYLYMATAYFKNAVVAQAGPFQDRTLAEQAAASYADRGWSVKVEAVS
jgi:hypothetical protein